MNLWKTPRRGFWAVGAVWCVFALGLSTDSQAGQEPKRAERATEEKAKLLVDQPRADFVARRKDLMERIKQVEGNSTTVVVLRGEGPAGDSKYKQSNPFVYLTGVEIPNASLILWPLEGRETLYLPARAGLAGNEFRAEVGESFGPGPEAAEALGFQNVKPIATFLGDLFQAVADNHFVYILEPNARPTLRFGQGEAKESRDAKFSLFLREGAPTAVYKDLGPILNEMRKNKYEGEITLLRKAISITGTAQTDVIQTIRPGLFEYELEGKVLGAFISGGAERVGFDSIVGSGINGTFPHYFANRRKMEDGDLVIVDIGAEYRYYTADITRTYPVNGKFTPRQREIYQLVLDCQSECAKRVKPGTTTMGELNQIARDFFRQSKLKAKGQIVGVEQSMDMFFIHGLGHYLGMEVHDVGNYGKPLQPGEVITIEPGIYIKGESIGVRIEDDYLVTKEGVEKLSKDIVSDPDEIERLIARARSSAGER